MNTSDLWTILEPMLGRIVRLEHRPSAMRSSFALEEIDVDLADGRSLQILLKNAGKQGLLEGARQVKPSFLHNPLREIEVYRSLLAPLGLGTAHCYGAVIDPEADRYWLFLERVPGRELYQVGEFADWQEVARWLARFHRGGAGEAVQPLWPASLLRYEAEYYRLWLRRAMAFWAGREARAGLARLARGYERVIERLLALPATFLHGEFYASNVLVQETAAGLRVCPVDWEMAAVGPRLMDLAALTAGGWTENERNDLALVYHSEWGAEFPDSAAFLSALDHCRLHLAVQWLGWARDWSAPPLQRQDWLAEAMRLADRINL